MKTISSILIAVLLLVGYTRCSEDIPECPGKLCLLAGKWKLTTVFFNDEQETIDVRLYQLTLDYPKSAGDVSSTFTRTQSSGNEDAGTWSIENNGTILRLLPGDNSLFAEDWIMERFSPRELVLVINRNISFKEGPAKIRFILEPF
jgi:hypothetical protein